MTHRIEVDFERELNDDDGDGGDDAEDKTGVVEREEDAAANWPCQKSFLATQFSRVKEVSKHGND